MNFDKIIKRSENYNKYNNNEYLTYSQLASKVENYADTINDLKLQNLSKDFQIIAYRNKLTLYKRFNVLLANEDVDRVRQLMKVCLNNGCGIKSIIEKFSLAANDMYRPKGFSNDDVALGLIYLN